MVNNNMIPSCRFCGADPVLQSVKGKNVFGGRPEHHFWLCGVCGIIYLYPPLSEAEEEFFYKKEFEKFMAGRAGKDMDWTGPDQHVRSNQREIDRRLRSGKNILEVGCSSGFMLSALKAKGMQVTGIEPSGTFVDYVRGKDIAVFQRAQDLKKTGLISFDAIIHYYLLEHIRHPEEFIKEYMSFLPKGGIMIFEVPCASDPLVELYSIPAFDNFYWSIAHHWYFTRQSLANVLKKIGFTFELYPEQRYDLSNHMTWMLNAEPGGYGRWSNLFGEALDHQYKERLKELWLCDTIIALLRK
jgi:SAM-dependent methyltransferase